MPVYCDSHVHFDGLGDAPGGVAAVVERAILADVRFMIAVGGSADANRDVLEVTSRFSDNIWAAVGYDRNCAGSDCCLDSLEQLATQGERGIHPVAIGEIGLDFHYCPDTAREQQELFSVQLAIARSHKLPVIVHSRDADEETLAALRKHGRDWSGSSGGIGVLHCFSGDVRFAQQVLDCGFHISFSGIATFKNAEPVREAIRIVPLDRLLLETDSPFLAPVPNRGKRNEPAYLPHVAEAVAEIKGCPVEEIASISTRNAKVLFRIGDNP